MIESGADGDSVAAKAWLAAKLTPAPDDFSKLERFVALLLAENERQNLVAKSTEATIWWRHIVDSAQLLLLAGDHPQYENGLWVDLGSGPGLPGLVVAILRRGPVALVEMRPARTDFLARCVNELALANVAIFTGKVERYRREAGIISARAFAPLPKLIAKARHMAQDETLWLLPKGKNAVNELAELAAPWHSAFHVKQSVTSPESTILVGKGRFGGGPT